MKIFLGKNHVDCVIAKIRKTIQMIAKLGYFVPSSVLLNIYKSLILPNITINSLLEAMHPKNIL